MTGKPILIRLLPAAVAAAACLFAASIMVDTVRTVVPLLSPLPWFDSWATMDLLRAWQDGDMSTWQVLFAQHNEHRILLPRLFFFADDLVFRGQGRLSVAATFVVQVLHAGMFAAVLARAGPRGAGRWAVAGVVLALMFSLRQAENFSSGFQLQFVAVFAGATLTFLLFGLAVAAAREGRSPVLPLGLSLTAALGTSLTMANGLVAGFVLAILAAAARLRPWVTLACLGWAALLAGVYLHGYEPVAHHTHLSDSLRDPSDLLLYVATYLGSIGATDRVGAAAFGMAGIVVAVAVAIRVVRQRSARPSALALFGTVVFVGATAAITGSGRLGLGVEQALSSRYVTGSATFWAALLTYGWVDPPNWRMRFGAASLPAGAAGRVAVALVGLALSVAVRRDQASGKPDLYRQNFVQNESENILLLGLYDPAVLLRVAWGTEGMEQLMPMLKAGGLSIFGTPEAAAVGRPVADLAPLAGPEACTGGLDAARADPSLGPGGVRVSGRAFEGPSRRLVRRVVLADARGAVVGLASAPIPGEARDAWRGFAVAAVGAPLSAYGWLDGTRLCRLGAAVAVAGQERAAVPRQASQPEAAP